MDLTPEDRVLLPGTDRLAGSALRMDRGVENLMRLAGLTLADAVRMATVNAARAGRVERRTAGLAPGDRADIVLFDFDQAASMIDVRGDVGGRPAGLLRRVNRLRPECHIFAIVGTAPIGRLPRLCAVRRRRPPLSVPQQTTLKSRG